MSTHAGTIPIMNGAAIKPLRLQETRSLIAVIPARDEGPTVGDVVRDVIEIVGCDVLVIDDASSDNTAEVARAAGATVLTLPFNLGAWGATQAGLRYAANNRYRMAVTLDADGQHHAESIPRLVGSLRTGNWDVIIGACPQRLSVAKHVAWSYFRWLTQLKIQDFTSGLRVYSHRALKMLASKHASLLDYQDIGVLLLLKRRGLTVHEETVCMSQRQAGHSRVFSSWFAVTRYMFRTTLLCVARIGRGRLRKDSAEAA